jgi:hypothetical protein
MKEDQSLARDVGVQGVGRRATRESLGERES